MEALSGTYTGPVSLILDGQEVDAEADLQAWGPAPTHLDEQGREVHDLDEPGEPIWTGTVSLTPGEDGPLHLPMEQLLTLTLRLPKGEATAELESPAWDGETMVLAVAGKGTAPF